MYASKLVALLRSLEKKELLRLEAFLHNPYFVQVKRKDKVLALFDYLKKCYPDFNQPRLQKERTFAYLFPEQVYVAARMDKLMASLVTLVKKFIVLEYADASREESRVLLTQARFYRHKQLDKFFRQTITQLQRLQDQSLKRSIDFYFTQYLIERERAEYAGYYSKRKEDLNLPNTIQSLDHFYIAARLEFSNAMLAQHHQHIPLDVQDDMNILQSIAATIEDDVAQREPLIAIYFQAFLLVQQSVQQEQAYLQLRQLIAEHGHLLHLDQMKSVQALCRSFCVRQHNRGNKAYLAEAFQLYKDHLEAGYLYYNNGIHPGMIKNLVNLGLQMGEQDWVLRFLKAHQYKIVGTKTPDLVYQYNLANYYFSISEYDKVIDYLMLDQPEDTYYKLASKRLEIKVYYESNRNLLESKMNAFKIYLHRISSKFLPELHRNGNRNFINLLWQVQHPQTLHNEARIEKLMDKIKALGAIVEKEWLLEKLMALRG
ncbi:MAG: hypothetical protein AAGG75_07345 [Bacteroidota bacterium]